MKTYPLLQTQTGIFLECMKYPESTQYNLPTMTKLSKEVDLDRLEAAIGKIYQARRELRIRFVINPDGEPRQYVSEAGDFRVTRKTLPEAEVTEYVNRIFIRPFDLFGSEPLLRTEILETEENRYLLTDGHHIIMDGTTCASFLINRDMSLAYMGEELAASDYGMPEYAEEETLSGPAFERDRKFYLDKFAGKTMASFSSGSSNPLGKLLRKSAFLPISQIDAWCKEHALPVDGLFQAAFSHVLCAFLKEPQAVYTQLGQGRYDKKIRDAYGMYVETFPVLAEEKEGMTAEDFIKACVREKMFTLRHHFYPFTHFCRELHMQEAVGFNFLALQGVEEKLCLGDMEFPLTQLSSDRVFSDLSVSIYLAGDSYEIRAASSDKLNEEKLLTVFADAVKDTVENMMKAPERLLSEIPLVSEEKERALALLSAGQKKDYGQGRTWIDCFLEAADADPESTAVVSSNGILTYKELDEQSDAVAAYLIKEGIGENTFAAVKMGRVKEFPAAVLGIQKAGAAYIPIDPEYPEDRISYMLSDSGTQVVLTEESVKRILEENRGADRVNRALPEDYAYMIYTSGSTGRPKGVVQSHASLYSFVSWRREKLKITAGKRYAHFNSFSFDGSLDDLICPLAAGAAVYLLDENLRRSLPELAEYIVKNEIKGMTASTQFGMELIRYNPNLPLDYLMMGGEKLLPCGKTSFLVINGYGPTEFTVCSSYHVVKEEEENIPIGRPVPNTCSYICDHNGNLLPQGMTGELCLSGAQMAEGYWKQPELTKKAFTEIFICGEKKKVYRTGDLARYNASGELEYAGRRDSQVKLRGYRIEFGEIENQAMQFSGLEQAAAEVRHEQLVLYYTVKKEGKTNLSEKELQDFLSERLASYMVPTAYMHLEAFPLTPGGKIDRKHLPEPKISGLLMEAPANETEKKLFLLAAEILGTEEFGVTDNLISLGLSSIAMMRFAAAIAEKLSCRITVSDMMKKPEIRRIAESLSETRKAETLSEEKTFGIRRFPLQEYYPLTENQKGVYFDWEMNKNTTQYNIPSVYVIEEADAEKLAEAVRAAVDAHPSLKSRIVYADGELSQKRMKEEAKVELVRLETEPDADYFQKKVLPFDLLNDRLYRAEVVSCGKKAWLFLDLHHIVFDGISGGILIRDILASYKGQEIAEEAVTAWDFALYEQEYKESEEFKEAGKYFAGLLGEAKGLVYPDSSEPDREDYGTVTASVSGERIAAFCKENGLTEGSFLQAAFSETLRRVTREDGAVYASVSSGRMADPNLLGSIGMYVKTLPSVLAAAPAADETVLAYVRDTAAQIQNTIAREGYPYTKIVEDYGLHTGILFSYQGGIYESGEIDGVRQLALRNDTVKFDLCVTAYPDSGNYVILLEYNGRRYGKEDMRLLAESVCHAAQNMTKETLLSRVSLLTEEGKKEVFALSSGEMPGFPENLTFVDLFEEQVRLQPDHPAVEDELGLLTYAELDRESDRIAAYLIGQGVRTNEFVIIRMHRFKEFAAASIGCFKAGACYIPIDPEYPEDRIRYMEENSEARFVLDEERIAQILKETEISEKVNLACPENLAYMIYTSGSSGRPKGAMIPHRALTDYVTVYRKRLELTPEDRISHHITFSFDSHIHDLYVPLSAGASVYFLSDAIRKEPDEIAALLDRKKITGSTYATSMGVLLMNSYDLKQRYICVGGEALRGVRSDYARIFNVYGVTECTNITVDYELEKGRYYESAPIGRPLPNSWVFVLDSCGNLQPQGLPGEICFAGPQVGRGYWKLPEKTAQTFTDCPFVLGERMYHTGDLGRYNKDGLLEYMGRIDFQVKLRGFRIELGEVESRAVQYEGMRLVAAAVKKDLLVLYYTANSQVDKEALKAFLAQTLTEYMVPGVFVQLPEFPMTPNGKIDRKKLPDPEISGTTGYEEPGNKAEVAVAECMQAVLGAKEKVGALDSFFELGGDSIKAIRMTSLLRQKGFAVNVSDIMKQKTVRKIAATASADAVLSKKDQKPYEGWVTDSAIFAYFKMLNLPVRQHFNQSVCLKWKERVDADRLQKAWNALTFQHDLLRAVRKEENLFVRPADTVIPIRIFKVNSEKEVSSKCRALQSEIVMTKGLVSCALFQTETEDHLFIAAHHLIVDGVSWRILLGDLETAYRELSEGKEAKLPDKTSTYEDYSRALRTYRTSEELSSEIPYWRETEKKLLSMPGSFEKPHRFMGKAEKKLDEAATGRFLHAGFSKAGLDANDVLLTAVCRSYQALTGETGVSVQLEGHGREAFDESLQTDRTVGWFTSIYPVIFENLGESLRENLLAVKETLHRVPNRGFGYNVLRFLKDESGKNPLSPEAEEAEKAETLQEETGADSRKQKMALFAQLLQKASEGTLVQSAADQEADGSERKIARIGFNYLGEMTAGSPKDSLFETDPAVSIGDSVSAENVFGPDLSLNCDVTNGCFHLMLDYNKEGYTADQAEKFALGIFEAIDELTKLLEKGEESFVSAFDLGEDEWTEEEFAAVREDFSSRRERIERIYPLLPMQEGMLFTHESDPKSWAYRLVSIYEINCLPTEENLRAVLKRLGEKYEVLRTAIIWEGVTPARQAIIDRELSLTMTDLTDASDPEEAVKKLRERILTDGYDLQKKPLFAITCAKKTENSCYILMATHHIIVDGWCMGMYQKDFFAFLGEEITGKTVEKESGSRNGRYEAAVREIRKKDKKEALSYWKTLLEGYDTRAEIASFGDVPEAEQTSAEELYLTLDRETTEKYEKLCREAQATISNGAELAWGLVLQTYSRTEDAVFAKVVSGRDNTNTEVNDLVGLFVNSVPVRVKTDASSTPRELLQKLEQQAAATNRYDFCPLSEIQQVSELGSKLISSFFAFENYNSGKEEEALSKGLPFAVRTLLMKEEKFDEIEASAFLLDGKLYLRLTFNRAHYRRAEIERILELFRMFVTGMAENPDSPVSALPRLSEKQEKEILALSSGEKEPFRKDQTFVDLFEEQVRLQPDHLAVEDDLGGLTYAELDKASDRIASYLLSQGVKTDEFVAIRMHRFKEFAAASIGCFKAGACYIPIDPEYPEDRVRYMEENSEAKVILDEERIVRILRETKDPGRINLARPENLAYMIYTSGSSGKPKGAMIPHSALMDYVTVYRKRLELTPADRISHHITFSFDSHIHDLYVPLSAGASVHFMSDAVRKEPDEIAAFLEKKKITGSTYATSMGVLLMNSYDLKQRYICVGGEALRGVRSDYARIFNVYGVTECTNITVDYELEKGRYYESAPIGRALPNSYAFIVDPYGHLLPQGVPGEICFAGPQVGKGYWKLPEKTAQTFTDCPFVPGEKMYHTGDLGRYREDGLLEYLGRIDFQVKLRGFRIELGEVESRAVQYEGILLAAAVVRKDYLVLYYSADRKVDPEDLKAFMAQTLTGYMVPGILIQLSAFPMTPNGKIDRKKLPAPELPEEESAFPETDLEKKIAGIVGRVLAKNGMRVNTDLVSAGMTSLAAMKLSTALSSGTGLHFKVLDIMQRPTIRALAEFAAENQKEKAESSEGRLKHEEEREYYPITENQRGIYIDWEMNRQTTQYNIPNVFVFHGRDPEKLAEAVEKVVDAHSYLKTRLALHRNDEKDSLAEQTEDVMQQPHPEEHVSISVTVLDEKPDAAFFQKLVRPFDLFEDCLCRFAVYTFEDTVYLFTDIHHILFDGLSGGVFLEAIEKACRGEEIPGEEVSALDYALYEQRYLRSDAFLQDEAYFDRLVEGAECVRYPVSEIPDTAMGESAVSEAVTSRISAEKTDAFCQKNGVTPGSFLQAAFAEALYRLTREEKPLYVTISNGRSAGAALQNTLGMFVKTLPAAYVRKEEGQADRSVSNYVKAVHEQLQQIYARECYPYTRIVEKHRIRAQILFAYQGGLYESGETIGLSVDTAKLPIMITVFPVPNAYEVSIEYDGSLYCRKDVQILADAIAGLAETMAVREWMGQAELVSAEQKHALRKLGAGPEVKLDPEETIVSMFRKRARLTPDAAALVFHEKHYTYREIDELTDRLAVFLEKKFHLGREDNVGVLIHRSELMVIYPIAIMKTGAAYMVLDPSFPADRLALMCSDASLKGILSEEDLVKEKLSSYEERSFNSRFLSALPAVSEEEVKALQEPAPDSRLIIIYTSGSTGLPKGVELEHRGLVNYVHYYASVFDLKPSDRISAYANFGFDAHMLEIYPALFSGACLYILDDEIRMDFVAMRDYFEENGVTVAFFTTQVACLFKEMCHSLRGLSLGGEKMPPVTVTDGLRLLNIYGPTECTIGTTADVVSGYSDGSCIGRPIPNMNVAIVDQNLRPVPCGVPGELLIWGPGEGRGYLNRPELTAEKFVEFSPEEGEKVKAYRSGDLVRWAEDGTVIYIGRIDTQVKLRGYRIELGEIEKRASSFEGIVQVAVEVKGKENRQLCCYYVSNEEISEDALREYLGEKLAKFMIPDVFIRLPGMPYNANGKIDRKALPMPERAAGSSVFEEPKPGTETVVAKAVAKILGLKEAVSATDSFYALGGDSIKAIRLVSLLREEELRVTVSDIMNLKTVRKIAEFAENQSHAVFVSQKAEEGNLPDSAIVSFYKDLKLPNQEHFIQSTFLRLKDRADVSKLQQALDAVTGQHDMLRAVIKDGELFIRKTDAQIAVEEYDLRPAASDKPEAGTKDESHAGLDDLGKKDADPKEELCVGSAVSDKQETNTEGESHAGPDDLTESKADAAGEPREESAVSGCFRENADNASNRRKETLSDIIHRVSKGIDMSSALLRAALIHTEEADLLYLAAHHLIIDGVSWRILTADLETAYAQLLAGKKAALPLKTTSYPAYAKMLGEYRNSGDLRKEIPYWNCVQEKLERTGTCRMKDYGRTFGMFAASMNKEDTLSFIRADREKLHLEINDLMLTAVVRSYCRAMQKEAISVQLEGHGRETFAEGMVLDRTIGWFTSIYPVVFENMETASENEAEGLRKDLLKVKENLHRIPNKGAGYLILRYLDGEEKTEYSKEIAPMIGFNYLGEMDAEQNGDGLFAAEASPVLEENEAREHKFGADLDMNCAVSNGCFGIQVSYNESLYTKEEIETITAGLFRELKALGSFLNSCSEEIATASDFGESEWSEEEFERVRDAYAARGERIQRIYPLLPMQEGMLYKHISEPDSWAYRFVSIFELNRVLSKEELQGAAELLGRKYEVLRTGFVYENLSAARQVITDRPLFWEMRDLSKEADPEEAVKVLRAEIMTHGFDLEKKPLFQLICAKKDEKSCYLLVAVHHLIIDGWSQQNYLGDLFAFLAGQTVDESVSLDGLYERYVRRILQLDKQAGLDYFKNLLKGYETKAQIPSRGLIPEEKQSREDEIHLIIDREVSEKFATVCRGEKATVSNGVELVWGLVLQTYSHTEDAVFAKVVSGRDKSKEDLSLVTGLFINSVPVRVTADRETTARQMLARLQQQAAATNEYDYCPLAEIQKQSELGSDLLQTVIAFQNYNSGAEMKSTDEAGSLAVRPLVIREETFDALNVTTALTDAGELTLNITFDQTHYTEKEIRGVAELFRVLATEIAENPDRAVGCLPKLDLTEEAEVARLSEGEKLPVSDTETWMDLFLRSVKTCADRTAVSDISGSITYRDLDRYSDAVAAELLESGLEAGQFAAVKIGRVREFVIALIGIMKAGAAYIPIDTEYPEDRIRYMLDDSEAKIILTEESVRQAVMKHPAAERINLAKRQGKAYMIYTSGSTGRPKGVIQTHDSLYHFAAWRTEALGLKAGGHYGHFNSFSFDGSLDDLVCPLAAGGAVYIFSEEIRRDLLLMDEYMEKNAINGLTISTQMGMELIRHNPDLKLDYLMMGGEKLLPLGKTAFQVINGYGPTEFTVCSSYYMVRGEEEDIPIGRPVPNTASYICDRFGNLVAQGVTGEICLAGPQMAEGYWKMPELTAERFTEITVLGRQVKVYRTGDLARYNEEGQLEYVGRTDTQVKLRGFRVEFGEIESRALQHPSLAQAAADVRRDQLVLYYTVKSSEDHPENRTAFEDALHAFIAETVTDFMVPTIYVRMEEMPLTPNGKVDRKALPDPEILMTEAYVEPANETEAAIAETMKEVLELSGRVGALDRFYALGGDSIKVIRLISLLHRKGISLKVSDFKELQTVRKIAAAAAERSGIRTVSQEAIEGEIKDSAIICFFKNLQMPSAEGFTQDMLLAIKDRADKELLQKAMNVLTRQHDLLRAAWRDGHLFVRNENTEIHLQEYTLSEGESLSALCDGIRAGIDLGETLFAPALIHTEEKDLLFISAHHVIVDGVSWRILVPDLEAAYGALLAGEEVVPEEKTASYRDYAEALAAYRNSPALAEEIPYWNRVQSRLEALPCSDMKDYTRSFGTLRVCMEEASTRKILQADRSRMNLEINDLLLTAAARAFCKEEQTDAVSIQLEGHGREDIAEGLALDRTVGWFTSVYPVVMEGITAGKTESEDDIQRDLITVKEELHRIPAKGVGYNILRFIDGEEKVSYSADRIAEISFNYLGEVKEAPAADTQFLMEQMPKEEESGEEKLLQNVFGSDLNINCMAENGCFVLILSYNHDKYDKKRAEAFAKAFLSELEKAADCLQSLKEPVLTASDFGETEWTEEEFEETKDRFAENGEAILRILPLTSEEAEAVTRIQKAGRDASYGYCAVFEINSLPTEKQFERAAKRLQQRYEILRSAFVWQKEGAFARRIETDRKLCVSLFSVKGREEAKEQAFAFRKELMDRKADLEKDGLLKLVCIPQTEGGCLILTAVQELAVPGSGLSPELLSAKFLAYLAGETGHNFRIADLTANGPVQEFYRNKVRICGMSRKYDAAKPTLIFPSGIILYKSIQHLIEAWSENYNVLLFDTINLHYKELFGTETFDDVMDLYMTLAELMIPEPDKIFACIGYSFGGEMAYCLASRLAKVRNCQPVIFLGDTDLIPSLGRSSERTTTAEDFDDSLLGQLKEHDIPQESMVFAYNMLSYFNARKKTLEAYRGKTVLFLALQNTTPEVIERRKQLVSAFTENLEIREFPDRDHFSLHTDPKMAQVFEEMLDKYSLASEQ